MLKGQFKQDEELTASSKRERQHQLKEPDYHHLVPRLQEILQSLLAQKQLIDEKLRAERLDFEKQVNQKNRSISQLLNENQSIKEEVRKLRLELDEKQEDMLSLKNVNERLEYEKVSLKSVLRYLEVKNKDLNYQIFEMKKSVVKEDSTIQKVKEAEVLPKRGANYMLNRSNQQSFIQYTGSYNRHISNSAMRRIESMPVLQFSIQPTPSQTPQSIIRNHPTLKLQKSRLGGDLQKVRSTGEIIGSTSRIHRQAVKKLGSCQKKEMLRLNVDMKKKGECRSKREKKQDNHAKREKRKNQKSQISVKG